MLSPDSQMKYLLLQARNPNDLARAEEHKAFASQLDCAINEIVTFDILTQKLSTDLFIEYDMILVGGSGEYSVLDNDARIKDFIDFLSVCVEHEHPLFASCFGFQALVVGLGGKVIKDVPHAEVGTYQLNLTEEGKGDPLFGTFPHTFNAQLGHQDRASILPEVAVNLAYSERCPFQAFTIKNKPVYATQFHPELTYKDNRLRFARYMAIYGKLFGEKEAQARMDSHKPSPESNTLLKLFSEKYS